jgi:hypothetical protein
LLVERISLRGICRAVGVTLKWLLGFLVQSLGLDSSKLASAFAAVLWSLV